MVVEYVTGLKVAWDVAKTLKTATDAIGDAEIKLQIADLISALADAKIEAAENAEKIATLEKVLSTNNAVTYEAPYYWCITKNTKEGPFCQQCFDNNNKLIRLQHHDEGLWICSTCEGSFYESSFSK